MVERASRGEGTRTHRARAKQDPSRCDGGLLPLETQPLSLASGEFFGGLCFFIFFVFLKFPLSKEHSLNFTSDAAD